MAQHQLAFASFTISGTTVQPAFWTKYFGLSPDIAITKGDPISDPTGQNRAMTRRTGVWGIESKRHVDSDSLEPHLRHLVERLALPRPDLRQHVEEAGARMRFFCYWDNESGHRVPDVPNDIRAMMEAMGGTIEVDEYR